MSGSDASGAVFNFAAILSFENPLILFAETGRKSRPITASLFGARGPLLGGGRRQ